MTTCTTATSDWPAGTRRGLSVGRTSWCLPVLALSLLIVGCNKNEAAPDTGDSAERTNEAHAETEQPFVESGNNVMNGTVTTPTRRDGRITLGPNTFLCLRETIEPKARRLMELTDDMKFGGPIFGSIQAKLRQNGKPISISGSTRFISLEEGGPERPGCESGGDNIQINLRVGGNDDGSPYFLEWEVRQQTTVRTGSVERRGRGDFPWPEPPSPLNVYDHALRQEAQIIGRDIADAIVIGEGE